MAREKPGTIDDFLQGFSFEDKSVAVIGPNYSVSDDPSLLYFANRMAKGTGSLFVIDKAPHLQEESQGNIYLHMPDLLSMPQKGVRIKEPGVVVADLTKLRKKLDGSFDYMFETGTFKCMLGVLYAKSRIKTFERPTKRIVDSYHRMLKVGGFAFFVYADMYLQEGYQSLIYHLERDERFSMQHHQGFADLYVLREIDVETVKRRGKDTNTSVCDFSTPVRVGRGGFVTLGTGYKSMNIIVANKIR
jgi:hypothetical protein